MDINTHNNGPAKNKKLKVRTDYNHSAFCYNTRYKSIQQKKYEIMLEHITLSGRILDLGCGTGLLADFLQKKIFGADISFEMAKKASATEVVVQADMDFLPFSDSIFDAVLSFTALQNLYSTGTVFKEVCRVLKPGSPFIFTILKKKYSLIKNVTTYFTIKTTKDCGEDTGFICY
ncbi:MAG: class I SAM-dependent methyltransferase [Candidatus Methanofastidiosia archaeon]